MDSKSRFSALSAAPDLSLGDDDDAPRLSGIGLTLVRQDRIRDEVMAAVLALSLHRGLVVRSPRRMLPVGTRGE